jgi:hypothetical protein
MNIMPVRRPMLARLIWLPDEPPCAYHRCWHRDHASSAPRTSFTDVEDIDGSRHGATSNSDLGPRVRLASLKSP